MGAPFASIEIARTDSGRADGTRVILWASYTDLETGKVRRRIAEVFHVRGHLHKARARDLAVERLK